MSDIDAVLFANEVFYRAFADCDVAAMDGLWAVAAPVCCIHPGWEAIYRREDVMASWRAILTGNAPPDIRCIAHRVHYYGDAAFVVCYEAIGDEYLIATNFFIREEGRWKMAHHQAGPTRAVIEDETDDSAPSIN